MEKQKLLLENFKELKNSCNELNSQLTMLDDIFNQQLKVFEQKNNCKLDVKQSAYYQMNQTEIDRCASVINEALETVAFDNYFDACEQLKTVLEFMRDDLDVIYTSLSINSEKELLDYQFSQIDKYKKEMDLILNNIDALIDHLNSMKVKE